MKDGIQSTKKMWITEIRRKIGKDMPSFLISTVPADGLALYGVISTVTVDGLELPWWCHQMETFSAFCAGNSPVTGEFPAQRPVTRNFDVFFDLRLNKPLGKQSWGWWFEMPWCSLWRHCDDKVLRLYVGTVITKIGSNIHRPWHLKGSQWYWDSTSYSWNIGVALIPTLSSLRAMQVISMTTYSAVLSLDSQRCVGHLYNFHIFVLDIYHGLRLVIDGEFDNPVIESLIKDPC